MNLYFDTETNGRVNRKVKDKPEFQPGIVQIAAVLEDDQGRILSAMSCLIEETKVGDSAKYHGITQDMIAQYGLPQWKVLDMFGYMMARAKKIIAHNIEFDHLVVDSAIKRCDRELREFNGAGAEAFDWPELVCTKELSADLVNLPPTPAMVRAGRLHPKSPTLAEAYKFFTGNDLQDAHDALADVHGCRAVYKGILAASEAT